MMRPRSRSPLRIRTHVGQLLRRSSSTNSLPPNSRVTPTFPPKVNTRLTPKRSAEGNGTGDIVAINKENYRLHNQCKAQSKSIQRFEERIEQLKAENDVLKRQRDEEGEVLKKMKAKFLYVPDSEVLSRQCIELKAKADSLKIKCTALRKTNHKLVRQNKSFKKQLNNTNTALHNLLSTKYVILNDATKTGDAVDGGNEWESEHSPAPSSSVCATATATAMQKDIENLEKLIENLDYAKNPDLKQLDVAEDPELEAGDVKNREYLNVEKILFEHGSLQNDNRDLALEIVVGQETNAKLAQSVNDLWLFANQLLLKLEKQSTFRNYSNRKVAFIQQQLATFKKMYHRTRFYFSQMAMEYKTQLHEMTRIVHELLQQNAECKEENKHCAQLKIQVLEYNDIIGKCEAQIIHYGKEKRQIIDRYETIVAEANGRATQHQTERDLLLQKLDSLMTKHAL